MFSEVLRLLLLSSFKAQRRYKNLKYKTKTSWTRQRRVVAKAEYLEKGENPRFVVTSISRKALGAKKLYEGLYCARGDMENRIKEQQMGLFADRTVLPFAKIFQPKKIKFPHW